MMLFTLRQYSRVHGARFKPNVQDYGWNCMRKFVQVRNQLMHPKSSADVKLNAEYRTEVNKGIDWFHVTIKELFRVCDEADEHYSGKNV